MSRAARGLRRIALLLALGGAACGTGPTLELGDNLRESRAGDGAGADAGERDEGDGAAGSAGASVPHDAGARDAELSSACATDAECQSDERPRCEDGECVEANEESDCPEGESCAACAGDADCADPEKPICAGARCVQCTEDADCAGEELGSCNLEGECG